VFSINQDVVLVNAFGIYYSDIDKSLGRKAKEKRTKSQEPKEAEDSIDNVMLSCKIKPQWIQACNYSRILW
jgi:hypothetical protein